MSQLRCTGTARECTHPKRKRPRAQGNEDQPTGGPAGRLGEHPGSTVVNKGEVKRQVNNNSEVHNVAVSERGPSHGLFVEGSIRSTKFRLLIDTGATDTLISLMVYYQLPKEQRPVLESCGLG